MISRNADSLRSVYQGFLRPRQTASEGTTTVKHYLYAIGKLETYLGRVAVLDDLRDETIWDFLLWLLQQGHDPGGVNKIRDVILAFWRFCNRKGFVRVGPDVPKIPQPQKIPAAFIIEELQRLFVTAKRQPGKVCGVCAGSWWFALLHCLFDSGERIGAVLQWQWLWLMPDGQLHCPADARKGRRKPKVYTLRPTAVAAIQSIRRDRELIFPWDRSPNAIYYRLDKILAQAGLPHGKGTREWKFHAIRRSHASYVKLAGGDPTESLGHDSRRTTERYLSPRIVNQTSWSDMLPEI